MTVPACPGCNGAFSEDEVRAAAIIATVSFRDEDRAALAPGGWLNSAYSQDDALVTFVADRLGEDGIFRPDGLVVESLSRVISKTVIGLLFWHFGEIIRWSDINIMAIDHARNVHPAALAENCRHDGSGWPEVTPSGRELERAVVAMTGASPPHMPSWRVYVAGWYEYLFLRRSNAKLLCAMTFHDALTAVAECPWPNAAGPIRGGKPRSTARRR